MYQSFFGLKGKPFSITPDPRFLYLSQHHREGLAHLVYGTDETGSFALLTGEIGTGKTTLSRLLLEQVPDDVQVALILNPMQTPLELLKSICDELSISYPENCDSRKELVDNLNTYLLDIHSRNQRVVVIIDEAQNLDFETLEQIRLLTNLETGDHKLIKIILIGQPELRDMINRPDLKQLSQRITARYHLPPLSRKETGAYIRHRLKIAGGHPGIFTRSAIDALYKQSEGVPRLINIFAERALLGAYAKDKRVVDKRLIKKAVNELLGIRGKWEKVLPTILITVSISLALAGLLLAAWGLFFESNDESSHNNTSEIMPDSHQPQVNQQIAEKITSIPGVNYPVKLTPEALETEALETEPVYRTGEELPEPDLISERAVASILPEKNPLPTIPDPQQQEQEQQPDLGTYLKTAGHSQQAYAALFSAWDKDFNINSSQTICEMAKDKGLECLYNQQGMEQLKAYNLPAILELKDEEGKRKLTMIHSIIDDPHNKATIKLLIDDQQLLVSINELNKSWDGKFLLLWPLPPGKESTLKKGMKGTSILWLASRLSKLSDKPVPGSLSIYNNIILERVVEFQKANNLKPDGIAGPETLIKIAIQTSPESTPTLIKPGTGRFN